MKTIKLKLPLSFPKDFTPDPLGKSSITMSESGYHMLLKISKKIDENEPFCEVEIPVATGNILGEGYAKEIEREYYLLLGMHMGSWGGYGVWEVYERFMERMLMGDL